MAGEIHALRTPAGVLAETGDDREARFCFQCRRRTPHRWQLIGDPNPSWYEPTVGIGCTRCGQDHTCFPGTSWDGPRPAPASVVEALTADFRARRAASETRESETT